MLSTFLVLQQRNKKSKTTQLFHFASHQRVLMYGAFFFTFVQNLFFHQPSSTHHRNLRAPNEENPKKEKLLIIITKHFSRNVFFLSVSFLLFDTVCPFVSFFISTQTLTQQQHVEWNVLLCSFSWNTNFASSNYGARPRGAEGRISISPFEKWTFAGGRFFVGFQVCGSGLLRQDDKYKYKLAWFAVCF